MMKEIDRETMLSFNGFVNSWILCRESLVFALIMTLLRQIKSKVTSGGTNEAQWEDVTGSTPLTFMNDRVSFTTTVSARFWLMDCRNIVAVPKMATELYEESLHVPYITK